MALLARIFGPKNLELAEDVVQDAFLTALRRWPFDGVPDQPKAWISRVARNRALDVLRRSTRWKDREDQVAHQLTAALEAASAPERQPAFEAELRDAQLELVFACCHPEVPRDAQVALVLKTVGGFGVEEIARAFLVKEATIYQRLVRAKRRLRDADIHLALPSPGELESRLDTVHESLYLMFNEGYGAFQGSDLIRIDLCREALRLASLVAEHPRTGSARSDALAALFHFQAARLEARFGRDGELLRLEDQDRSRWDRSLISRGLRLLAASARGNEESAYHLQAEIASCHSLAASPDDTNWQQILDAYDRLWQRQPSPVVALNRAVALGRVEGTEAALHALEPIEGQACLERYYPFYVTRGELLERVGAVDRARADLEMALELAGNEAVRDFVSRKLTALE